MFQTLRLRLLSSYLGVMVAILGSTMIVVYHFVTYNLYQKLDGELLTLADAAAHNLSAVKTNHAVIYGKFPRITDNDGDLDIPWQDLRENYQSIEWFDSNRESLGKAGKHIPQVPITENFRILQQGKIRSLTIPVYKSGSNKNRQILGYVRVSQSTEVLAEELDRLSYGLEWGGIIAVIFSGVGGWWLTNKSLHPIEQSVQQLKQFTADASHELRSPLTAIKTSVEVMQRHPERIDPADVKKLAAIASATNQMTRLVEDLLFLARTDAAPKTPNVEWVSIPLDELLEDLVDLLQPQAEAKGITLRFEIADEIFVKGDASQMRRLFSNLLENALQYTQAGGTVTAAIVSRDDRFVVVSVEDTGIGIAPEHIPFIFNRFFRADKARSRHSGGLGLGLAIAQAIAHNHKGEITISSQLGVGSCFQVSLPVVA